MSPRPGFVLEVDRSTPPTLFWHGEGFRLERLPVGSRVLSPPEALDPLSDPVRAIRHTLEHPLGDSEPLRRPSAPGNAPRHRFRRRVVAASPMRRPDNRQLVIEQVLDMAADAGVDDVVLIAALSLHRRLTESELRHALGDRVYDPSPTTSSPARRRGPDEPRAPGGHRAQEDVEINKLAAESDLLVYVNINLVAMDGGHKSVATGLASYRSLGTTTTRTPWPGATPSWTRPAPSCTPRTGAWAG